MVYITFLRCNLYFCTLEIYCFIIFMIMNDIIFVSVVIQVLSFVIVVVFIFLILRILWKIGNRL